MKLSKNLSYTSALIVFLLGLVFLTQSSCKKDLIINKQSETSSKQSSTGTNIILGINKTNGEINLYRNITHDFLSKGGDILIHKSQVEPIKIYKQNEPIDKTELAKLINEHETNKYILPASYSNDSLVCVMKGVSIWPNRIVRIGIDNYMPAPLLNRVYKAIELWREKTNIGFEFITYEEANIKGDSTYKVAVHLYRFSPDQVAYATVGTELGIPGAIVLSEHMELSAVVHEFAHTFGFIHEHQRPSRDNYITFQRTALMEVLPGFYNQDSSVLDFNNLAGTADPTGDYYQMMIPSYIQKYDVYSDNTTLAPFDHKSITMYPSYYPLEAREILMRYNAPVFLTKDSNELCQDPEITDPDKMISDLDIKKVNTVYPLTTDRYTVNEHL